MRRNLSERTAHKSARIWFFSLIFGAVLDFGIHLPANTESLPSQIDVCVDIPIMMDSKIIGGSADKLVNLQTHVVSDVIEDGKLYLPANTLISGSMACLNQNTKEERYLLLFNRLTLIDGTSYEIHAIPSIDHVRLNVKRNDQVVRYDANRIGSPTLLNDCPFSFPVIELSVRPRLQHFTLEPGDIFNVQLTQMLSFAPAESKKRNR